MEKPIASRPWGSVSVHKNRGQSDVLDHVENIIQSTEIEKFAEENKMVVDSSGESNSTESELKRVKKAKSGSSKLKMSSDVIELIRNQCGKHKSAAMAKALNVSVRAVQR